MAGEEQYINPIIQAMIASATLGQQQANRKQQGEQFQQEQKLREVQETARQKQIDALVEQMKAQAEHQRGQLELQNKQHLLNVEAQHNQSIKDMADFIKGGGNPSLYQQPTTNIPSTPLTPSMVSPGTPSGMVEVPGMGQRPISSFQTQEQATTALAARQKALTTAEEEAKDPFVRAYKGLDAQARLNEQHQELINSLNLQAQRGSDARQLEKIRAGSEEARTKLTGEYHLKGIEIANGFDPDDPAGSNNLTENLMDGILQGQVDINKLPKARKQQIEQVAAARGWTIPTDQKSYANNLNNTTTIQNLLNQARDLANNYSIDSPGGTNTVMTRFQHGQAPSLGLGTSDLNSKLDTFKAQAGQLVTTFDNMKRTSDANILRSALGAYDSNAKKAQNLQKVNTLADQLNNQTVKNNFRGMPADQVNHILSAHGFTDFGGYGQPTPTSPSGVIPGKPVQDPLGIR